MKKILFTTLTLGVGLLALTGCGKGNPIVGKWEAKLGTYSYVYTFNADGTCQYDAAGTIMKCTYKTDGDKLSILYDDSDVSFDTTYSISEKKLNVKDSMGNDTIYNRK